MNTFKACSAIIVAIVGAFAVARAEETKPLLPAPLQDQGLPYTRSARAFAMAKIKDHIAVFAGSRYAYVRGCRVRLDDVSWKDEAVLKEGKLLVPASFSGVLKMKNFKPAPAPEYLKDRWVYSLGNKAESTDKRDYVALADLAKADGLKVYEHPRGLLLIGETEIAFSDSEAVLLDTVISQFDTPEKFADPDIAVKYIPTLKRQGKWTDHVKATAEQVALLKGPETKWPVTPVSQYDYTGFNKTLLGSAVPVPGVYPRLLFSAGDIPMIAGRLKQSSLGQMSLIEMEHLFKKSWWDPSTSDGKIFQKLASGDVAGLEWDVPPGTSPCGYSATFKGQKCGIHNSHISYIPECLSTMALYCLLVNDDSHGRQAAAAIANYYKLREPLVDEVNAISDSEFGSSYARPNGDVVNMSGGGGATHWRTQMGTTAHMNLGLSLDFAGKWMTAEEKDLMRRVIAKATYGRRAYGQDGPARFRDVNWVTWDLPNFLAVTAIEGLEGFDREAYESDCETVRSFCEWGIDDAGVVYESNGKTPGGFQFQTLSMVIMARRGENLWGHPHWRKLLEGQLMMTSPSGKAVVNSGTQYSPFSGQHLSLQFVDELKAFFPDDLKADYLLGLAAARGGKGDEGMREYIIDGFSAEAFHTTVTTLPRLRLPSPSYPGFGRGVLYDMDFKHVERADLKLPLDFNAPVHGVFSSYSDNTKEAVWINMMVRPNHYLGAGHHHSDAGMIHFSGLGVDWFTESPFSQNYDGKYHNQVLVDGKSEPENMPGFANGYQAAATYLGAEVGASGSFASADLTDSYSYRWLTQPAQVWPDHIQAMGWEIDPSDTMKKMWGGTARYKMRPWWANYTYVNYIPTSRAPFNPMKYVFRSVGLIRGTHPYGVVVDDLMKDGHSCLYQWTVMLNGGVWQAERPGLAANQVVLAFRQPDPKEKREAGTTRSVIVPKPGDPLLLVTALGVGKSGDPVLPLMQVSTEAGPVDRNGKATTYDRFAVNLRASEARFRILLVPFRMGDELPTCVADKTAVTMEWKNQKDAIEFRALNSGRTALRVVRSGTTIAEVK